MRTLGWMQRRFRQSNDENSRNVSTRKSSSCFSALWKFDEQHYTDAKNTSAHFRQPRVCPISFIALEARGEDEVKKEETVEMIAEFFQGFLAIGTLGSVPITEKIITPKAEMSFENETEKETSAAENELQSLNKKVHEDTTDNKNMMVYPLKEYSEMPAIKEEEKEQKTKPDKLFKKNATPYKISGKLDKGVARESHVLHFIKKMLKKLDFTSMCNPTSAGGNDIFCDSTEKKPTKVFHKSRKIRPEAAALHVTKSHNSDVKKICHNTDCDKEMTLVDEDNSQPGGRKEHWSKTNDYFVLEF